MSGDPSWSSDFMLSMLQLLIQIRARDVVVASLAGAALLLLIDRPTILSLTGATLCGAVALTGAWEIWRSYDAPRQIAMVTARTVGAPGGDDDVEWMFEDPRSIFLHSRRPGDVPWIDGIRIFAKNLSARPLSNLSAVVRSHKAGRDMRMIVVLDDRQMDAGEPQTVPPMSAFSLRYVIAAAPDDRVTGIPAAQFLRAFGDLEFMFGYNTRQMFTRLVSVPEIEQQLLRIEREARAAVPAPADKRR
jgi:hypothetical protein